MFTIILLKKSFNVLINLFSVDISSLILDKFVMQIAETLGIFFARLVS